MFREGLAVVTALIGWGAMATVLNVLLRLASPDYAAVEKAMSFTFWMMLARLGLSAVASQPMAIYNGYDLHTLSASRRANLIATAFGRSKRGVNVAFRLINPALLAQRVGQIREYVAQLLGFALLLKSTVHRFVIRVVLRQNMPLSAGVENPQHGVNHLARRDRFASRSIIRNIFLRKMHTNAMPLLVSNMNHTPNVTPLFTLCAILR